MKKILILSYHALPMDVVASYRTKGFCDHLLSFGIYPTLLTHRWEQELNGDWKFHSLDDEVLIENQSTCTVIRLPRRKPEVRSNQTGINYLRGFFEADLKESYQSFRQFLFNHLTTEKYDAILTIYSPHFQMKLALELKRKFGIPYITDFRDLWDNQVITHSYKPSLKKRIIDLLVGHWWIRWIRGSVFFTVTGTQWKNYLEELTGHHGFVVRNGFEPYSPTHILTNQPDEFVIVHFGRLYSEQDLTVFLSGYKLFLNAKREIRVKLRIIGHKARYGLNIEKLLSELPVDSWEVTPYMAKENLFNYCVNNASVFWMPGFKEDNGQFPVKVYDYLMLGKNILYAPGDSSEVQRVIEETKAGVVCNSPEKVFEQLSLWLEKFKTIGEVPYSGNAEKINKYSRISQVKILAEKIHELIGFLLTSKSVL